MARGRAGSSVRRRGDRRPVVTAMAAGAGRWTGYGRPEAERGDEEDAKGSGSCQTDQRTSICSAVSLHLRGCSL
ncbi:hypothetical protein SRHO_G00076930 [Serrasalmus rhombeus]